MFGVNRRGVLPVVSSTADVLLVSAAVLFLACALSPGVFAQHRHEHHAAAAPREAHGPQASASGRPGVIEMGSVRLDIPDPEVLDQDGRRVRFYSDLIKDKVVVVSFFFTSCKVVCPAQTGALINLKARLAGRLGQDVFFVSITRDPETDTPRQLKRWGEGVGVGRGWTLVTGDSDVMSKLVSDFTGESLGRQMHSPILLIGNDRTGVWTGAEALSATEQLVGAIDRVSGRQQ